MNLVKKNFDIVKYLPGYNLSLNTYYPTKQTAETLRDDIIENQDIRKRLEQQIEWHKDNKPTMNLLNTIRFGDP